jgi:protein-S-isoprenylcysteine O-methyltransferase Ste14
MTAVAIPMRAQKDFWSIAGRTLAVASVVAGFVPCFIVFYQFDNGDRIFDAPIWVRIFLCLLQFVALPIAWWIGRSVVRATAARAILVAGMAFALALEVRIYWNVFPLRVGADLAVIAVPMFQLFFLAIIVLSAWLTGRWISGRS